MDLWEHYQTSKRSFDNTSNIDHGQEVLKDTGESRTTKTKVLRP